MSDDAIVETQEGNEKQEKVPRTEEIFASVTAAVGQDISTEPSPNSSVLVEAMKELREDYEKKQKDKVKELAMAFTATAGQVKKVHDEANKRVNELNKRLNAIAKQIVAIANDKFKGQITIPQEKQPQQAQTPKS